MGEIQQRRKALFSGARFSCALFCNGDQTKGESASFGYFSGSRVDGSYLVLKRGGGVLLTHSMNYEEAKASCCYPVRKFGKEPAKDLKRACGRGAFGSKASGGTGAKGSWKVGFSPSEMSAARYFALRRRAKLALVDAGEKIAEVRGRKSKAEVQKIAASARIAKRILDGLRPWEFRTEAELDAHLRMRALEEGCTLAFEPIVASGKNSALPHHKTGNARLGDFVLVDFGTKLGGYCSDFTRCYFRKKGMPEQAAYEKCRKVYAEMVRALPACRTGKDVALLSDKLLKKYGMPSLIHSVGHGIGIEVHEYPHLGAKSDEKLEGAVLALEPAAYFARFGVRYEGMVAHINGKWREI